LQQPCGVREIRAGIAAGRAVVISFSEPVLLDQSVAIWRGSTTRGHARLVELLSAPGRLRRIETHQLAEWIEDEQDPLLAVLGRAPEPEDVRQARSTRAA